jgi:DNA repair protein RecO (recombination protein O)
MANSQSSRRDRAGSGIRCRAIVWKRFDFTETSRIVALLTRDHGIVHALAKGAHRVNSPLRGHIDFLSDLDVQLSHVTEGLRKLARGTLVRERRGLRHPSRFLCASHLVNLCDAAFAPGTPDPELFDLVDGGLALIELCPLRALPTVALGLELRLLQHLGSLPDLDGCTECGVAFDGQAFVGDVAGSLACRDHAAAPRRAIGTAALEFLRTLRDTKGKAWPEIDAAPTTTAIALLGRFVTSALERHPRLRSAVFARTAADQPNVRAVDSGA